MKAANAKREKDVKETVIIMRDINQKSASVFIGCGVIRTYDKIFKTLLHARY
jgi:hypothetical protein